MKSVIERAIEVIGDRRTAMLWMMISSVPALDGRAPIECSEEEVLSVLNALERGSW
jgi:hypothetical protein